MFAYGGSIIVNLVVRRWNEVFVGIITIRINRIAGDLVIATSRSHDEKKDVWSCGKTKKIARLIRMREDR